jgi:hypothetical protein
MLKVKATLIVLARIIVNGKCEPYRIPILHLGTTDLSFEVSFGSSRPNLTHDSHQESLALIGLLQLMNELEEGTKVLERQVGEEVSIYPNDGEFVYEIVIETQSPGEDDEFSLYPCEKWLQDEPVWSCTPEERIGAVVRSWMMK